MPSPGLSLRSVLAAGPGRLLRFLCGPNTRQARLERLSLLGLAASALALLVWGADLSSWERTTAWILWLLAGVVLLRRAWLWLSGPVLRHDLVRSTRRARPFALRCFYLVLLLSTLAILYANLTPSGKLLKPVGSSEAARFALAFFETFACTQLALVVLLTPAYVAGAIAEEKESRTLEFVLATDLHNHEIVLGKLVSRLAHLVLLMVAGLPFLSALQFLGGVDPNLVLAAFAGTGLTLVSEGALSILASVLARRARGALLLTYEVLAAYAILCLVGDVRLALPAPPPLVRVLVGVLHSGSPIHALIRLSNSGGSVDEVLPDVLRDYALFHSVVAATCVLAAIARLRVAALREPRVRASRPGKRSRSRRPVGNLPMVWKEVWADPGWGLGWTGRLLLAGLILASFVPLWFVAESFLLRAHDARGELNAWVRGMGTLVACVALLGVAVRAAGSMGGERDRNTFDSLLTTPLTGREILFGKWLGSIAGVRWLALWLGVIWGLGVLGGGLSILAVPLLVAAWLVYAAALSSLGLCFSVRCPTTRGAVGLTVLATLGLSIGHWFLWLCCLPGLRGNVESVLEFEAGFTPPVVLGVFLPFHDDELFSRSWQGEVLAYAAAGTLCWAILALFLWAKVNEDFNQLTGRVKLLPSSLRTLPARSSAPSDHSPPRPSS